MLWRVRRQTARGKGEGNAVEASSSAHPTPASRSRSWRTATGHRRLLFSFFPSQPSNGADATHSYSSFNTVAVGLRFFLVRVPVLRSVGAGCPERDRAGGGGRGHAQAHTRRDEGEGGGTEKLEAPHIQTHKRTHAQRTRKEGALEGARGRSTSMRKRRGE